MTDPQRPLQYWFNWRRLVLIAALGLAFGYLLSGCDRFNTTSAAPFNSTDITGASFAREFALTDHDGQARTLADFKGKVVVVFFGFLNCPDICPTTLAEWSAIREKLSEADRGKLQILFVTVDPERDSAERMKPYVTNFHASNLGLTGSAEQIEKTAKEFKVIYQKVEGKTPGSYTMDHSAASFVFDQEGKVRLYVRMGQPIDKTVADVQRLLSVKQ